MAPTKPSGPTPVEAIVHGDKRTNLPTADAHDFVSPAVEEPRWWEAERDANLDAQLVWVFVRHCYFTGGQDPFTKLKRDLKAEIDEDAWATLH